MRRRRPLLPFALAALAAVAPAFAQPAAPPAAAPASPETPSAPAQPPAAPRSPIPETFTNLMVLPPEISRPELIQVMRGFTAAIGGRCESCHATKPGADPASGALEDLDFASDAREQKQTARRMLQMVADLNLNYLDESPIQVQCATCHRGVAKPEPIEAIVTRKLVEGPTATADAYRELRGRYYGAAAYDFSEGPLNRLGQALLERGEAANALVVLRLNGEHHPDSARLQHLLGEALFATGDRDAARAAWTRSLELDPANPRARQRLEALPPPAPTPP